MTNTKAVDDCICPVCGADIVVVYLEGSDKNPDSSELGSSRKSVLPGRILRCHSCSFGFRQRRFNQENLTDLYRKMDPKMYQEEFRGRERTAEWQVKIVVRVGPPGRPLDVGCASGLFLTKAADAGWQVTDIEPADAQHNGRAEDWQGAGLFFRIPSKN